MIFYHYCSYCLPAKNNTLQENFYHINDDLLVKHLLGETDQAEAKSVNEWLAADAANRTHFEQLKKVWDRSLKLATTSKLDENIAWDKFKQRISNPREQEQPAPRSYRLSRFRVAAIVALLAGAGWLLITTMKKTPVTEMLVESHNTVVADTLPDASIVTLNKSSSISYPSSFNSDQRNVQLKGEAFFNITPGKKKPFIISVEDVQVTVVGTSFNVRNDSSGTDVIVETGIVKVTRRGVMIELRAGERVHLSRNNSSTEKQKVTDKLYNYYRTREFACENTPLWKLVELLNQAYATNIVIGRDALKQLPITATFNNESLEQVLKVISLTFNIRVSHADGMITLY